MWPLAYTASSGRCMGGRPGYMAQTQWSHMCDVFIWSLYRRAMRKRAVKGEREAQWCKGMGHRTGLAGGARDGARDGAGRGGTRRGLCSQACDSYSIQITEPEGLGPCTRPKVRRGRRLRVSELQLLSCEKHKSGGYWPNFLTFCHTSHSPTHRTPSASPHTCPPAPHCTRRPGLG